MNYYASADRHPSLNENPKTYELASKYHYKYKTSAEVHSLSLEFKNNEIAQLRKELLL
jgi:hypothetical protein